MHELDIALRVAVVCQLLFAAGLLIRAGWPLSRARAMAMWLIVGLCAYMYCSMGPHTPALGITPLVALCILIPPSFWLFASAAFDDEFRFAPWHVLPLLAALALGFTAFFNPASGAGLAAGLGSRGLALAFILGGLWVALRGRRMDLVESRRRFRDWLTAIVGLYMLGVVVAEIALLGREPAPLASTLNVAAILLVAHLACHGLAVARVNALEATPHPKPAKPAAPSDPEAQFLERLRSSMEEARVYRENGLTIAGLARKLGMQEYALRRLINQRLGYRNFNEFLNRYRLRDACQRLRAVESRTLPVLTIALDVGYGSITPFNRAFKQSLGMTPTQYREAEHPPPV